ncbi:MAG: CBS domain-containing protein [Ectothiorhodospiraceae bacterium]|nr:CBS domain-containing protein [Ectothiorhodospiraceae bacterium]
MNTPFSLQTTVADVMRPPQITCRPGTGLRQLLLLLADNNGDCALVLREDGRLQGMVLQRDLHASLAERDVDSATVQRCMIMPARLASPQEPLYRALAWMRSARLPCVPVVDGGGRTVGLLHREDAQDRFTPAPLDRLLQVALGTGPRELYRLRMEQTTIAAALLEDCHRAAPAQALISQLNDDCYRALTDHAVRSMEEDGWGAPPAGFSVIVMGSGGRRESLLAPDQDNGLIISDYPDREHGRIDRYFTEMALRLTHGLDAIGIPYCPGHVMASNPLWRKSLSQWIDQGRSWVRRRTEQGFLNTTIMLDFRHVAGDPSLPGALRQAMTEQVTGSRGFLQALTLTDSTKQVGLSWFNRLMTESADSVHEGEINLKRNAIMPLVEAVRLHALSHELPDTSTQGRLAGLAEQGVISDDELDSLRHAHEFTCFLLLRQQIRDSAQGRPPGRHMPPTALTSREHGTLIQSMKATQAFLKHVHQELFGSAANL